MKSQTPSVSPSWFLIHKSVSFPGSRSINIFNTAKVVGMIVSKTKRSEVIPSSSSLRLYRLGALNEAVSDIVELNSNFFLTLCSWSLLFHVSFQTISSSFHSFLMVNWAVQDNPFTKYFLEINCLQQLASSNPSEMVDWLLHYFALLKLRHLNPALVVIQPSQHLVFIQAGQLENLLQKTKQADFGR